MEWWNFVTTKNVEILLTAGAVLGCLSGKSLSNSVEMADENNQCVHADLVLTEGFVGESFSCDQTMMLHCRHENWKRRWVMELTWALALVGMISPHSCGKFCENFV